MGVKTVLVLTANPQDTQQLGLLRESRQIKAAIQRSEHRDDFAVVTCEAARAKDVRQALRKHEPHIVHFSGHGAGESGLALEDELGHTQLVKTEPLAELLSLAGSVECVVLNACHSVVQAEAIAQSINWVISMSKAIQDNAAREFSEEFYGCVGDGKPYAEAFEWAKNAIATADLPGADLPRLTARLSQSPSTSASNSATKQPQTQNLLPATPEQIQLASLTGAVSLDSPLYVTSGQEKLAYEAIQVPGSLLRIRSPKEMGKSSLNLRLMNFACQQSYRTVTVDFREANTKFFQDQDRFTQWFCASVGRQLGIRVKTEDYWDDIFGANGNCEEYFETYVLKASEQPLVLALENYDQLFDYPEIEKDFSGLLRGRHDHAKLDTLWQRLRLVLVYSQEAYETQDINQSPFNVGLPITLGPWTAEQVGRSLQSHGLNWSQTELNKLMVLTGGHPQLVRIALAAIANQQTTLAQVLVTAATEAGIYSGHLLKRLTLLEANPELRQAMQQIVGGDEPVRVKAQVAKKLDSMGLIVRQNYEAVPLCDVYRLYFRERL